MANILDRENMSDFLSAASIWAIVGSVVTIASLLRVAIMMLEKSRSTSITISSAGTKTVISSQKYSKEEMEALIEALVKTQGRGSILFQDGRYIKVDAPRGDQLVFEDHSATSATGGEGDGK